MSKSLLSQHHELAPAGAQVDFLEQPGRVTFAEKLRLQGLLPFTVKPLDVFQVNVGKMCNQVCKHCHVDAGPDRQEIMSKFKTLIESGKVKPFVGKTVALAEVPAAIRSMQDERVLGRIIVTP